WLDRRLALEREIACDEIAVSATGSPKQYAACLAALASLGSAAAPALPVPAALSSSALARRVGRILAPTRLASRGRTAAAGSACVLVLAVLCVSASGVR